MKVPRSQFPVLSMAVLVAMSSLAEESTTPVAYPKLEAYAPLWERSLFTTKDLPAPDAPAGPSFADNLSLSGVYELQGEVVALIVDKTTSQVFQAKIGSDNEIGVKVRKIDGEITSAKIRVQLQKGDQVGWVTLSDGISAVPAETIAPAGVPANAQPGLQTRQMPAAAAAGLLLPPNTPPGPAGLAPQAPSLSPESTPPMNRRNAPVPASSAAMPPAPAAVPPVPQVDGIPLPPP